VEAFDVLHELGAAGLEPLLVRGRRPQDSRAVVPHLLLLRRGVDATSVGGYSPAARDCVVAAAKAAARAAAKAASVSVAAKSSEGVSSVSHENRGDIWQYQAASLAGLVSPGSKSRHRLHPVHSTQETDCSSQVKRSGAQSFDSQNHRRRPRRTLTWAIQWRRFRGSGVALWGRLVGMVSLQNDMEIDLKILRSP
jgi:hypothetical protein